jgi:hypothetical protein
MKEINNNIYPKEGYYFKESDGSKHFGQTWNGVIARVVAYRRRAGLPPGNPREEVINQACQRTPILCVEDNGARAEQLKRASLKTRVLQWMNAQRANPEKHFVEESLSHSRAAVCAKCPKNTALPGGCASCVAAVKGLRGEIIGRRPQDGRLNACVVLGEDCNTSIQLDLQTVENGELPAECWRRRSI